MIKASKREIKVRGYNQGCLATIKYKSEILRLKMGMYEITNDYKIQYL